jgi:hypothetical protein
MLTFDLLSHMERDKWLLTLMGLRLRAPISSVHFTSKAGIFNRIG